MGRIELPTSPLPRECSTTEPHGHRHWLELREAQTGVDTDTYHSPFSEDSECSTLYMTEPLPGAGDGNRTRVISLEG